MSKAEKEITESMAVIKRLKPLVLQHPMEYSVIDLCAGNALTGVIAVHMLPVKQVIAIDKKKRKGNYDIVKRFIYLEMDINQKDAISTTDILISVHPCQTADRIIDIFNNTPAHALILMPCCNGMSDDVTGKPWLHAKMSEYDCWTYHLANNIQKAKVNIYTDNMVLSPKNNIIVAKRGK